MSDTPGPRPDAGAPDENVPGEPPPRPSGPPPGAVPTAPPAYASTSAQFSIGDALSVGFGRFAANWVPWVLVTLVLFAVEVAWSLATGTLRELSDELGSGASAHSAHLGLGALLLSAAGVVIAYFITAFLAHGALLEATGHKPAFAEFFGVRHMGGVVLAALIVGVATSVGLVACIVPGLVVALFSAFVYYAALDRGLGALDAVRTSWSLVAKNVGSVLGLLVLLLLLNLAGTLVCLVGLLVTVPVSYIAVGYAYRTLGATVPA